MLLNYDFLEFENDKKVRVIDDKLCVNIFRFFGIGDEDDKIFQDFMSTQGFITKYKYSYSDYIKETQRLKSFLDGKRDFLGYIQAIGYWKEEIENDILPNKEISFFVFQNEPSKTFNLRNYLLLLARLFGQEAICYCKNANHDKENTYKVELVSALSGGFNEMWAEFADVTFSVPSQLPQSLTRLKNKAAAFFSKQPGGNCGMSFKEIDKVQIKATCMPNTVNAFEDDIKLSIQHNQWRGYPKVFDIEKIESIEREVIEKREQHKIGSAQNLKINQIADDLKQGEVVSNKLIANALITQKTPSDTPHDEDLD